VKAVAVLPSILALLHASAFATVSVCSVTVEQEEHGLEVSTEIEGIDPGKYSFGFDPSCESLELVSASFARTGAPPEELPSWAVDTLTGTDGYPLALFVAFPPGGSGSLSVRQVFFDRLSIERPSLVLEPPIPGADVSVLVRDAPETLLWQGQGYSAEHRGDDLLVVADSASGPMALSWIRDEEDLYRFLVASADSDLVSEPPLSSREAAIEAGAAGAAPEAQLARLRTIICNSFRIDRPPAPGARFDARPLREIFRTRIATPLEVSVAFVSVCRGLGFECDLLFAGNGDWGIPVAADWDRVLVEVDAGSQSFLLEPSAVLVPAFYIQDAGDLWILSRGDGERRLLSRGLSGESCEESWRVEPDGGFALDASGTGAFDVEMRRRLAGLGAASMAAVVSTWLWRSGFTLEVDSVWTSDLYDLGEAASIHASGSLPPLSGGYLLLPALSWGGTCQGGLSRSWEIRAVEVLAPSGLSSERLGGSTTLSDTLLSPPRRMARIGGPR
jgi:hypothetical protein